MQTSAGNASRAWMVVSIVSVSTALLTLLTTSSAQPGVGCSLNTDCGCVNETANCSSLPQPGFCNGDVCSCNPGFGGTNCTANTATPTSTPTSTPTTTPTSTPNGALGASCISGTACLSTFCVSGVCCNTACNGPGQTCATGVCTAPQPTPAISTTKLAGVFVLLLAFGWIAVTRTARRRRA